MQRPNIIVLLADDLGYGDLGVYGCPDIPTPHLDELAAAGVRCTDGYASCPVCSPTRAGLLTGRYQQRFGFEYNPSGPQTGLDVTEETIGDRLHEAGYVTGAIGKWHLGKEPQFHPLETGFDEFYGFVGGARPFFPIQPDQPKVHPMIPNDPLVRGRTQVDDPEYLTDAFGDEAAAFIDRHQDEPFFLYVAFNAVHVPLQATEKYLSRFPDIQRPARRTYAAMLSAMDDAVGRVSEKLQATGLDDSTLVFFLSDNGGHPTANAASNKPLRGQKSETYEGGIRVPFIVKWTGHLPAGETYSRPVISLDILPTALAAAGIETSSARPLDGVNLLPYLTGKIDGPPHETLYFRYGNHRGIRHGDWKLTTPPGQEAALYDLSQDISESNDLASDRPEIVKELKGLYSRWDSEVEAPRWRSFFQKDAPGPK